MLLYVLSIPKIKSNSYHLLLARATIRKEKQVDLPYDKILISQNETYGVKAPCLNVNQITICKKSSLTFLSEDSCIPHVLKGENASCRYRVTQKQIVKMVTEDTIFLIKCVGVIQDGK